MSINSIEYYHVISTKISQSFVFWNLVLTISTIFKKNIVKNVLWTKIFNSESHSILSSDDKKFSTWYNNRLKLPKISQLRYLYFSYVQFLTSFFWWCVFVISQFGKKNILAFRRIEHHLHLSDSNREMMESFNKWLILLQQLSYQLLKHSEWVMFL